MLAAGNKSYAKSRAVYGGALGNWHVHHSGVPCLRGELALLFVVFVDSMGVQLVNHSGMGISAISSVSYSLSLILPKVSQGMWMTCFQMVLVMTLMIMRKRIVPEYLLSFVAGAAFGWGLDLHASWINTLSLDGFNGVIYYIIGYLCICLAVAVSNRCKMPVIPTDLFARDFSEITGIAYAKVKTGFDLICLAVTIVLTVVFLGFVAGLGVGTVVAAFTMGKVINAMGKELDKKVSFVSVFSR